MMIDYVLKTPILDVYLMKDDGRVMAECPQLDLVTEMATKEEALNDLMEMIREYVDEYISRRELFEKSPNRSHHKVYIDILKDCQAEWEYLEWIHIYYGHVSLSTNEKSVVVIN
ncbi:MAG: hypothetical protein IEMM0008_1922 [bacterium]|nr:MAG: hypothetical protein IEMM0008_1922 [bacterium]